MSHRMGVSLYPLNQIKGLEVFYNPLSCLIPFEPSILSTILIDISPIINNNNQRKSMFFTDPEIIRVMGRCYLDNTSSKLHINMRVCYDRNLSVHKGKYHCFSHKLPVSLIIGINSHTCISKHSFRSCSGYNKVSTILQRVSYIPEITFFLSVLYLFI